MKDITQERLKEILKYHPETGEFKWLATLSNIARAGSTAGTIKKVQGYIQIRADGRCYYAHRLAWLYMTGSWPKNEIDHINGNPADNRFFNLREASRGENSSNRGIFVNNKSGVKGVHWHATKGRWRVNLYLCGKEYFFGYHTDLEFAELVASEARIKLHGEFSRDR